MQNVNVINVNARLFIRTDFGGRRRETVKEDREVPGLQLEIYYTYTYYTYYTYYDYYTYYTYYSYYTYYT